MDNTPHKNMPGLGPTTFPKTNPEVWVQLGEEPRNTNPTILATTPKPPSFQGPNLIGSLSTLLRSIKAIGMMYDASTLATLKETVALKAVIEPMLIRARSKPMTTVTPIE